jgi:predicted O-methyltransferase YrrM
MKRIAVNFILLIASPITFLATFWLKLLKKAGSSNISDAIFMKLGVLPVVDHYYQPMINPKKHLIKSLREDRNLTGIDMNVAEQLALLSQFNYQNELLAFPMEKKSETEFYFNNDLYMSGDADYLYNIIRHFKPKRIIEIGSGHSTLMCINALKKNKLDDNAYTCEHICVEPYEQPLLEKIDVILKREKVEEIELSFFQKLEENDILFIDSSHIIRPQGDVLFEYLELLPTLKKGVIVHVHDIFTPKDYLDEWIYDHKLWNEQYLLEAFLTFNKNFKIIGALNYLSHHFKKEFAAACPIFAIQEGREPGAFWMQKV